MALSVWVSTTGGANRLVYHGSSGTNSYSNGWVHIYLGTEAASTTWHRFERNIEADVESFSGYTWTNSDGLLIRPGSAMSYDLYIDDIRFSDSKTVQFNALRGGSIGQIAAEYTLGDFPGKTVKWLHYDRLGNVMNKSGSAGTLTDTYHQDAYGNVLSNVNTGAWASASSFSGRHLTTKEYDNEAYLYYFWQRWYDPRVGRFTSHAEYPQVVEHPYGYVLNRPSLLIDVDGLKPNKPPKKSEPHIPKRNPINPMDIYDLCKYTIDCAKAVQELNRAYAPGGACDKYFKNPHDITCLACCKALVDFYNTCSKGGLGVGKQIAERCVMDCTDL